MTLQTDNQVLAHILTKKKKLPAQLVRWAERISEFQPTIQHSPGDMNKMADLLSRDVDENFNMQSRVICSHDESCVTCKLNRKVHRVTSERRDAKSGQQAKFQNSNLNCSDSTADAHSNCVNRRRTLSSTHQVLSTSSSTG